jgi:hypothetical protein
MIKNLVLVIIALYALSAFANTDYSLQGTYRGYPLGASVDADAGYSFKLWESNKNKAFYGYVRPAAQIKTSGIVNYVSQQVDFFPISFLGFYVGRSDGFRNVNDLQGFDCAESVNCGSDLSKTYMGANLALAHKKFILLNLYRIEKLDYDTNQNFIAEETSNLIVSNDDEVKSLTTVFGYQLAEDKMLALLNVSYKSDDYNQDSNMLMALGQLTRGKISYQLGLGNFKNRNDKNHFSSLFIVKWSGEKGLRLF